MQLHLVELFRIFIALFRLLGISKLGNAKNRIPSQGDKCPFVPIFNITKVQKKKLHFFPACRAVMIFFFAPPSPKRNFKTFIIGCTIESPNFKECLSGPSFLWPIILMNLHIGWRFKEVKAQVQHQHPKLKVSFFQEMNLNAFFVVSNYSIILETCSVVHFRKFKSHTLDYIHHENFGVPPDANPPNANPP